MKVGRKAGWILGAALSSALLLAGPAGAVSYVNAEGELSDLSPAANATDDASAEVWAVAGTSGTTVLLYVWGINTSAVGMTFGAHVHVGPCIEGNGAAAGPHYNSGGVPDEDTEVWLDFKVLPGGYGFASAHVPFLIDSGKAQSVVVHLLPTQDGGATPGAAGGRQACLPVNF